MTEIHKTIELAREQPFRLGETEIRPMTREVIKGEARESVEPRVMQVLVALAQGRGDIVTRDDLTAQCWNGRVVGDDAINRCITMVRKIATTYGGFTLETIPRVGYRLIRDDIATPDDVAEPVAPPPPPKWWRLHRRILLGVAALLVGIVAAGIVVWRANQAQPRREITVSAPTRFTVAVLPFTSLAEVPNDPHLGDQIASSTADVLSRVGCEVTSPSESARFRGDAKAGAAKALHVDFLIDGEYRYEAGRILVAVRVIHGSNGRTLVADKFDLPESEAASVPEFIANEVVNYGWSIVWGLNPSTRSKPRILAGALTVVNLMAHNKDTDRSNTVGAVDVARALVRSEPDDPAALMIFGFAAAHAVSDVPVSLRAGLIKDAREAARQAMRLDPAYGEPYAILALAAPQFNWAEREGYLRQALNLRPLSPVSYMNLVELLQNAGRFSASAQMAEEALGRNPTFSDNTIKAINARLWTGQIVSARALIERSRRYHSHSAWFAGKMFEATAFAGDFAAAEALLKEPQTIALLQPEGRPPLYSDTLTALRHRRPVDVERVASDCSVIVGRTLEFRRTCLMALAVLGRRDEAFRMMDVLYPDQRGATPAEIERRWLALGRFASAYLSIPVTAPLRADPRFRDVAARIGLLNYWKDHAPDFCAVEKAPVCREIAARK